MNDNPQAVESPPLMEIVMPWVQWGIGLMSAAGLVWGLVHLHRAGLLQPAVRAAAGWVRGLLVQKSAPAAPVAPPASVPRDVPPVSPGTLPASPRDVGATIAVAAIPSVASLVWTAWSLMDMIDAPWFVGLAAGVVLDVALVSAVAIAWIAPTVAKPAKITGWLIASLAAVLVGYHAALILPVLALLGVIPLFAKGLWHLALNARLARAAAEATAEEERVAKDKADAEEKRIAAAEAERQRLAEEAEQARLAAELSTELTHE